jgi:hypothetical protein
LLEIGTGWLGWGYDQTLDTPIQGIEIAHKGRLAMLRAIFGSAEKPEETKQLPPLSPTLFRAMFNK